MVWSRARTFQLNDRFELSSTVLCMLLSHVETKIYSILFYSPLWGVLPSAKRPEGRAARGRPGNVWQVCSTRLENPGHHLPCSVFTFVIPFRYCALNVSYIKSSFVNNFSEAGNQLFYYMCIISILEESRESFVQRIADEYHMKSFRFKFTNQLCVSHFNTLHKTFSTFLNKQLLMRK